MKEIELSLVTPMYNEEGVIEESVTAMIAALCKLGVSWELILVNDGSTDRTGEIARGIATDDDRIVFISYPSNRGRGYALRQGISASRGRYVITTESDLSWGVGIIGQLYDELVKSGSDIVIASPYQPGGRLENIPLKRALLSRLGNLILRQTVEPRLTMVSGMTRGYIGNSIRSLPLDEDRKEIHLEIVSKASIMNYRFSEVPAILRWEPPKPGHRPLRQSKFRARRLIVTHLLFGFNESPIMLFGAFGAFALGLGVLLGLSLLIRFLILGEVVGNRTATIMTTVFLVVSGLQIFLFCFLSHQNRDLRKEITKLRHELFRIGRTLQG